MVTCFLQLLELKSMQQQAMLTSQPRPTLDETNLVALQRSIPF